jgi:hypothetical protein
MICTMVLRTTMLSSMTRIFFMASLPFAKRCERYRRNSRTAALRQLHAA